MPPTELGNPETNSLGTSEHLVVLVHGINTRALWMGEVKPVLEREGFAVGLTSYGHFGVARFLAPISALRTKAIDRVVSDIRTARRSHKFATGSEPKLMSVICHSFGTYVIGKILTDYPEFQWHRVIFCGSVVREDFRFDQVLERFKHPLLNEVGTRDFWPAMAESVGWGYGSVGSTGFNRPPVETRWHLGFRHSDFLTEKFCIDYWVPFLRDGKRMQGDKPAELPLHIRAMTWIPLRWIVLAACFSFAFGTAVALRQQMPVASTWLMTTFRGRDVPTSGPPTSTPSRPAVSSSETPASMNSRPSSPASAPTTEIAKTPVPNSTVEVPRNTAAEPKSAESPSIQAATPTQRRNALLGRWVDTKSGESFVIMRDSLGHLEVAWSSFGLGIMLSGDGQYGSNLALKFPTKVDCYYYVSFLQDNNRMAWSLRGGSKACPASVIAERAG